jgi:hypothetical protein
MSADATPLQQHDEAEAAADRAREEAESAQLEQGFPALSDDHLYFAFGDIAEVYLARTLPPGGEFCAALFRFDPLAPQQDAMTPAQTPVFVVRPDGRMHLYAAGIVNDSAFTVKALQPFGERQFAWLQAQAADDNASLF